MKRMPDAVRARAFLVAAALFAAASPVAAQQVTVPPPVSETAPPPATPAPEPLRGPRVQEEWRRVEPSISDSRLTPVSRKANHTITLSTLALVLVVVILVLLIA